MSDLLNSPKRSPWVVLGFAALGLIAGAVLVVSGVATTVHADRDHQSPYRLTVTVVGAKVHQSAVASTEELRPRMRAWGYGLTVAFAVTGGVLGAAVGWGWCRATTHSS